MSLSLTINKIATHCRSFIINWFRHKPYYFCIYRSYWHYKLFYKQGRIKRDNYFTAIPNQGAGIGHQLANWIAGRWFATQLGLKYAYSPFSDKNWDKLLGFGENEITINELVKKRRFKKVQLPHFDEFNSREVSIVKKIINSYCDKNVVFIAEKDQGYQDQIGIIPTIQEKFFAAPSRNDDEFIYSKETFNIAVHVRRGDIAVSKLNTISNLKDRWQDSSYFINVLNNLLPSLCESKPFSIYLFSQGNPEDFKEFSKYSNMNYCLDMNAKKTFLHMVYADLLITSKSSFSYKPALLSKGIKICPSNFWHRYPKTKDWILADEDGSFNVKELEEAFCLHEPV